MRPAVEFLFPHLTFFSDRRESRFAIGMASECFSFESRYQRECCCTCVATNAHRNFLDQTEHLCVCINLNNLGVFRPVINAMLRQRSERPQTCAQCDHDIGFANEFHRGFRALIAQRPAPEGMVGWEAVIVQIAIANGRVEQFCELDSGVHPVAHDHATP